MKHTRQILIFLLLLLFFGCDDTQTSNQSSEKVTKQVAQTVQSDSLEAHEVDQFSIENIQQFGDSLISYFNIKAGYDKEHYEVTVDTIAIENYTKTTITVRTKTYKTHGLISYDIFTFLTKAEATDFFNDLKTQELIVPYGLNKRPNHILVDSNRVFWHHLEHSYGHRIKQLTQIFSQKFNFRPHSTNLDSVSGFTYCRCKNDDLSIDGVKGKWNLGSPILIEKNHSENQYNKTDCFKFFPEAKEINLHEDSIFINRMSNPIEIISSIKLPDNRLFWKYYFLEHENQEFNDEFSKKLEKIKIPEESLTLYEIKLTNHCYISLIKLEKGKTYMIVDNEFYALTK